MAISYIPPTDAGLRSWAINFASRITAAPATYGLDALAAAVIQSAANAYVAAYDLAANPATRTPVAVAAKDAARIAAVALFRTYGAQIRINPGVTNADKISLGLNLPNNSGTPIPAPSSFPLLTFLSATPLGHQFSYADSLVPTGKAKAPGAVQLQLFVGLGTAPRTDVEAFLLKEVETKSPFLVLYDSPDSAKIATYAARWVTRRGLVGPWSALSNFLILAA